MGFTVREPDGKVYRKTYSKIGKGHHKWKKTGFRVKMGMYRFSFQAQGTQRPQRRGAKTVRVHGNNGMNTSLRIEGVEVKCPRRVTRVTRYHD